VTDWYVNDTIATDPTPAVARWMMTTFKLRYDSDYGNVWGGEYSASVLAESGNLKLLKWMTETFDIVLPLESVEIMLGLGRLDMLKWTFSNFKITSPLLTCINAMYFRQAVEDGSMKMCKWIDSMVDLPREDVLIRNGDCFTIAAGRGHLRMCKWLYTRFELTRDDIDVEEAFTNASHTEQAEVLIWMNTAFDLTYKDKENGLVYVLSHESIPIHYQYIKTFQTDLFWCFAKHLAWGMSLLLWHRISQAATKIKRMLNLSL